MGYKDEKALQTDVSAYLLRKGGIAFLGGGSFMYEVKLVRMWRPDVRGLRFSELPDHELKSLLLADSLRGMEAWTTYGCGTSRRDVAWAVHHKISDSALGYKPCDGLVVSGGRGWLIVGFDFDGTLARGCATRAPKSHGDDSRAPKGRGVEVWAIEGWKYVQEVWKVRGGRGSLSVEDMRAHGVRCW
jgi:hypothetical protein